MAKPKPEQDLKAIEQAVARHPDGATIQQIAEAVGAQVPRRTLQYRLRYLVNEKRLVQEGERRWAKYRLPAQQQLGEAAPAGKPAAETTISLPVSSASLEIQTYLRKLPETRKPVGYNREFLESYRPNTTAYLSEAERAHLREAGTPNIAPQAAGTYAKQILSRLLIDLSWNSSRLEGN